MIDRHLVGDVALAILLAVPTAALSRPQATTATETAQAVPAVEQAALADQSAVEKRFTLGAKG